MNIHILGAGVQRNMTLIVYLDILECNQHRTEQRARGGYHEY